MKTALLQKSRLIPFLLLAMASVAPAAQAALQIDSGPNLGTQSIGVMDAYSLFASGGTGPTYTWTLAGGTLPPGISIRTDLPQYLVGSGATAALVGVAITPGVWTFTLRVTNDGVSVDKLCTMTISSLLVKDYWTLQDGFVGHSYSHTLTALRNGIEVSPAWTLQSITPAGSGLSIDAAGVLSGTPTASGNYNIQFTVTEGGETVWRNVNVSIFDIKITTDGTLPNATQGLFYSQTVNATGGTGGYTFTANGLPNGLNMSPDGTISGTTTSRGVFGINVTATSNFVSYTKHMSLDVVGVPEALPSIAPYGNAFEDCTYGWQCVRGVSLSNGGTAPFTWSATGLPPGLSIRSAGAPDAPPYYTPSDGEIWGTAALLGTYNVTITVTDSDGASATNTFPLKVSELAMNFGGPSTVWTRDAAVVMTPPTQNWEPLRVVGGPSRPLLFDPAPDGSTLYTGELLPSPNSSQTGLPPAGVAFSSAPALFSGTPTENISTNTRLRFTHVPGGQQVEASYYFSVGGGTSTIQINSNSNLGIVQQSASYSNQLFACCPSNSLTWTVVGGSLPPGLTLSAAGLLSASSGALTTLGTYTFLVRAEYSPTNFGQRQFTISISSNSITTSSTLPAGNVDTPYGPLMLGSSGGGTWSLSPFNYLPPGLTLSGAGQLSGTPTASGQYFFTVTVNGGVDAVATRTFTVSIYPVGEYPPLTFNLGPSLGSFQLGIFTYPLAGATGGSGTGYHYSLTPGDGVPTIPGLRVQDGGPLPTFFGPGTTAALLGVVTTPGAYNTSIRVTDSVGNSVDRAITLNVRPLQILSNFTLPKARWGVPYSFTLTPYGGTAYTWSAPAFSLPPGLAIDNAGTISGVPDVLLAPAGNSVTTYFPSVTLTDGPQSLTFGLSLTVDRFSINNGGILPTGTVGVAYPAQTLTAEGNCGGGCTWSMSGSSLPNGFSLSGSGVLSNTQLDAKPTSTANTSFTVRATGTAGTTDKVFSLQVVAASPQLLSITSPGVTNFFTIGNSISNALFAAGGIPPYSWTLDSGTLPPGVTLQGPGELLGGSLSPGFTYLLGRAMELGVYTFTVKVTDSVGSFVTRTISWTISPLNNQYFNLPLTGTITADSPYTQQLLALGGSAVEGTGSYTWVNTSPLPYGLALNSSTGEISGTPLEATGGNLGVVIRITDTASGDTITPNININVTGSTSVNFGPSSNLGTVQQGSTFSRDLNITGGAAPYTVTAVTPLPPGFDLLSGDELLNQGSGTATLAGTPLASGTFTFTLKAQDSAANVRYRTFTLTVARVSLVTSTNLPDAAVGEPYSQALITGNSVGTVNWSISSGFSLPPGLSLVAGVLTGTPTVANNSYSFSLDATDPSDPQGVVRTISFNLRVSGIRITDPQVLPAAVIGAPYNYAFTVSGGPVNWSPPSGLPGNFTFAGGVLSSPSVTLNGILTLTVTATPVGGGVPETRRFTLYSGSSNPSELDFTLSGTLLTDATVGQVATYQLNAMTGGTPPYTWSVAPASTLPPGLNLLPVSSLGSPVSLSFTSGGTVLTGVPMTPGQYTFDLILADSLGAQARRTFTLRVSAISILSGNPKAGAMGTPYSQQFVGVGGTPPYSFTMTPVSLNQDMLPPGLTLLSTGLISGTPTSTGGYAFFLRSQDSAGNSFSRRYNFTVHNGAPGSFGLVVSNTNPNDNWVGAGRRSSLTLSVSTFSYANSQTAPSSSTYSWSLAPGSPPLPAGMTLVTGQPFVTTPNATMLAGQPTTPGTYTFALRATDVAVPANSAEHTFTFRAAPMQMVAPPLGAFVPPDLPYGRVDVFYSTQLKMAGGTPPYTFAVSPFSPLPAGFTLSASGVLSGTPQAIGNYSIVPIVTDAGGNVLNSSGMTLIVSATATPAPLLSPLAQGAISRLFDASVGVPFSFVLDLWLRGGTGPFTWTVAPGSSLPDGLSLLPGSNGVSTYIGGVPTMASNPDPFVFSLVVTDSGVPAQSLTVPLTLNVSTLALTPATVPPGVVDAPYSVTFVPAGGTAPYTVVLSPLFDLAPGLTMTPSGTLHGTPTSPGNFPMLVYATDSVGDTYQQLVRFAVDNAAGQAPSVSLLPTPIQVYYETGSPNPAAIPISVNTTSSAFPFNLSIAIDGIPGASLSSSGGSTPGMSNLNLDLALVSPETYSGVLAVRAPESANLIDQVPVTVTVVTPPPCAYSLDPTSGSAPAAGESDVVVEVSAGGGCEWTAAPSAPWITINGSASGSGSGTISYSVEPNSFFEPRTGTIHVQDPLLVHDEVYSITQFGEACSFAISPTGISATSAGGTAFVNVTASGSGCSWTATSSELGVTPASGSGNGTVTVTIPTNPTANPVVLLATIAEHTFTVNQTGVNCTVGLSPYEGSSPAGGGPGSVQVTTSALGCTYNTLVGPAWVSVTSGGSGIDSGTLVYNVEPNSTTVPRSGTLTIGGQAFAITQQGLACSVTVNTGSLGSPYAAAGSPPSGTIGVTANGPNCSWTASSGAPWATVFPTSGTGNLNISVTVQSNTLSTTERSTDLTIAGQTVPITQAGTVCTYTLQSATGSVPAGGGSGSVGVVAPAACGWTSVSNAPSWLSIQASGSGGTGSVQFLAQPNTDAAPRNGTLTIATKTYTVTQAGAACSYALDGLTSDSVGPSGAAAKSFTFSTVTGGCSPAAVSYAAWISIVSTDFSGLNGTVNYSVAPNPTNANRSGTIQIGNRTFTVTQIGGECGYSLNAYGSVFGQSGGSGSVSGSPTVDTGCQAPDVGTSQPSFILLEPLAGPVDTVFTLPYSVSPYIWLTNTVRFGTITFGGQVHTVKQTSW